jgi:spore germination protein YaaH
VTGEGWDGVNVDLESLTARDRAGLSAFVAALRAALPAGRTLSVDIEGMGSASAYGAAGYDLRSLGMSADRLVLMAYDEHGPRENTPGPIGALSWTRAGLATVLRFVAPPRLDLGVAGYGYGWRPHANVQLSDAAARRLVRTGHGVARFDATVGEWTATLSDGSTLWWSDRRSFALRRRLAAADHLHGLAVWSLGLSDPIAAPS